MRLHASERAAISASNRLKQRIKIVGKTGQSSAPMNCQKRSTNDMNEKSFITTFRCHQFSNESPLKKNKKTGERNCSNFGKSVESTLNFE